MLLLLQGDLDIMSLRLHKSIDLCHLPADRSQTVLLLNGPSVQSGKPPCAWAYVRPARAATDTRPIIEAMFKRCTGIT